MVWDAHTRTLRQKKSYNKGKFIKNKQEKYNVHFEKKKYLNKTYKTPKTRCANLPHYTIGNRAACQKYRVVQKDLPIEKLQWK